MSCSPAAPPDRFWRIELADGVEQRRSPHGDDGGWANGLAFDARGRLYVGGYTLGGSEADIARIDDSGAPSLSIQSGPGFASLAFGRGALDCRDLYIAVPTGPLRRIQTDTPGLRIP